MKDTYITYILLIVAVLSITYVVSLKTKEGMENRKNLVFVNEEGAYDLGNRGRPLQLFSKKPSDGSYGMPGSATGVAARPVLPGQNVQVSPEKPDDSGVLSVPLIADPTESLQDVINKGVLAGLQQGVKDRNDNLTPPTDTAPTDTAPTDSKASDTAPTDSKASDTAPTDSKTIDTEEEARQLEADIQEQQDKNEDLVEKLSGYKREVDLKKESRDNTFIEDYGKIEAKKNEIVDNIGTIDTLWKSIEETIKNNLEVSELPDNYNDLQTQVESLKKLKTDAETIFNDTVTLKTEYDTNNNSGEEPNSILRSIENFETLNELKAIVDANKEKVTAYDNWKTSFLSQDSQLDRMNQEIDSKLDEINELKVPQELKENLETLKTNVLEKIAKKAEINRQQREQLINLKRSYQKQLDGLVENVNTKGKEVNITARLGLKQKCENIKINVDDITKLQEVLNRYNSLKQEIETYKSNYTIFETAKETFDTEIKRIRDDYDEQLASFELPKVVTDTFKLIDPEIAKPIPQPFTAINACQVGMLLKPIKDGINSYLNKKKTEINSTISTAEQQLAKSDITINDIEISLGNINPKISFLNKIENDNLPLGGSTTIQLSYLKTEINYQIDITNFNYEQLKANLEEVKTKLENKKTEILNKQEQERIENEPEFQKDFYRSPGAYIGPTAAKGELKKTPIMCNTTSAPKGVKGKTSLLQSYGFYGFNNDGINSGTNKYKYKTKCAINVGQIKDPKDRESGDTIPGMSSNNLISDSFDGRNRYELNCNFVDTNGTEQKGIISEIKLNYNNRMKYKCVFPEENVYSKKSNDADADEIIVDTNENMRYSSALSLKDINRGKGYIKNLGKEQHSPACPNNTYLSYVRLTNTNPNSPYNVQYQYKCMGRKKDLTGSKGEYAGNMNADAERRARAEADARKKRAKAAGCNNSQYDPWRNGGKCQWNGAARGRNYPLSGNVNTDSCFSKYGPKLGDLFRCFEDNNRHCGGGLFAGVGKTTRISGNTNCLKDRGINGSVWKNQIANFRAVTEAEYNKLKGNH